MTQEIAVYISALQSSLKNKKEVLFKIFEISKDQEAVLEEKEVDMNQFDALMQKKEKLIVRMQELDRGFDNLFTKIGDELKKNKEQYKDQILEMQETIRAIMDCSVKIQALEQKNKEKFAVFVSGKRKEIRDFRVSNRTVTSYYQNMAGQHHVGQSYFLDKKK